MRYDRGVRRVAIAVAISAGIPAVAHANGRFPSTVSVSTRPGDVDAIYLGATFGLLISRDDGAHFHWVCEDAIGYSGTFDPKYAIAADGTIYATTFDGLRVSRDGGCTFELATEDRPQSDPGRFAGLWVDAIDLGPAGEVWVATAEGGVANDVYRSTDGARTFASVGLSSPQIWWKSVRVAASDPQRVYVTGYQVTQTGPDGQPTPPAVHVRRSDNGGATWQPLAIADIELASSPLVLIEAVSPTDPDVVYARSESVRPPAGELLYRSADGGMRWQQVLETVDSIRGVVIRADGSVVVATVRGGVFVAADGVSFTAQAAPPEMACVDERADGTLLACGANWSPDNFALGRSRDAAAWQKVFRFVDISGPLACPAGTIQHDRCAEKQWPLLVEQLGIPVAPVADEPAPASGGDGGCGCAASGAGAVGALGLVAAAMALGARRKRDCCR
jgi:MYXO-CTERM domain-containing protein